MLLKLCIELVAKSMANLINATERLLDFLRQSFRYSYFSQRP